MDTKNIILAVIFTFSLLLLWESWTAQNRSETVSNGSLEKNKDFKAKRQVGLRKLREGDAQIHES